MSRRLKQIFLQRRHTNDQQTHEKMFNITNYQRNANQNYSEVLPHTPVRMSITKKSINKCWREKGTLLHLWQGYKLVQPLGKQSVGSPENKKQNYHMIQQSHSWAHTQTELNNSKRPMHPDFPSSTVLNSQDMEAT